jgi:hypothetical protein
MRPHMQGVLNGKRKSHKGYKAVPNQIEDLIVELLSNIPEVNEDNEKARDGGIVVDTLYDDSLPAEICLT